MRQSVAIFLATLRIGSGDRLFPDVGAHGGSIYGVQVIASPATRRSDGNSPGDHLIVLLDAGELLLAEGDVVFDLTNAAIVQIELLAILTADSNHDVGLSIPAWAARAQGDPPCPVADEYGVVRSPTSPGRAPRWRGTGLKTRRRAKLFATEMAPAVAVLIDRATRPLLLPASTSSREGR